MSNWVAEEHREWHYENGPSGAYGVSCPWDACGYGWEWDAEQEYQHEQDLKEWAELAPALREGETPAPLTGYFFTAAPAPTPDPWLDPNAPEFDPPF